MRIIWLISLGCQILALDSSRIENNGLGIAGQTQSLSPTRSIDRRSASGMPGMKSREGTHSFELPLELSAYKVSEPKLSRRGFSTLRNRKSKSKTPAKIEGIKADYKPLRTDVSPPQSPRSSPARTDSMSSKNSPQSSPRILRQKSPPPRRDSPNRASSSRPRPSSPPPSRPRMTGSGPAPDPPGSNTFYLNRAHSQEKLAAQGEYKLKGPSSMEIKFSNGRHIWHEVPPNAEHKMSFSDRHNFMASTMVEKGGFRASVVSGRKIKGTVHASPASESKLSFTHGNRVLSVDGSTTVELEKQSPADNVQRIAATGHGPLMDDMTVHTRR